MDMQRNAGGRGKEEVRRVGPILVAFFATRAGILTLVATSLIGKCAIQSRPVMSS
jgi:hypothetical protein